ncbi:MULTISPECIES: NusG domain II-containing protein [unclassified Bacillus (in: firmicutes)]|uniref:NusG domain II-containing protein n=1 Tax=unclassified Bacillus (in: firmicutes) TaxID=185979 RepID=UPI0004E22549|nr:MULTISPECIES: NusG domain II-containing protein [unclassified Bacillus (in: firmicutes)]
MKTAFHMIKPWDIIITIFLLILSLVPLSIFSFQQSKINAQMEDTEYVAVISVDGDELKRVKLTGHTGTEFLNIPEIKCTPKTVEIKDESIRIKSSTCPEQICVNTGYISKPGPSIICLPHRVVISVETISGNIDDEVIISS